MIHAWGEYCNAIRLKKNYGQTQALATGIRHAKGDAIVTMDSDLENDQADIPFLFAKLNRQVPQ